MQTTKITVHLDTDALVEVVLDNAAKLGIPNFGLVPGVPTNFETVLFTQSSEFGPDVVVLNLVHERGEGKDAIV